jgi:hypothetical protein
MMLIKNDENLKRFFILFTGAVRDVGHLQKLNGFFEFRAVRIFVIFFFIILNNFSDHYLLRDDCIFCKCGIIYESTPKLQLY